MKRLLGVALALLVSAMLVPTSARAQAQRVLTPVSDVPVDVPVADPNNARRVLTPVPDVPVADPNDARVNLRAFIDKDKFVFVDELVLKFKQVAVLVVMRQSVEGAAEAEAIANQLNRFNIVSGIDGDVPFDMDLQKDVLIENSINSNAGIVGVNQDAGNMVNQGNVVALALTDSESSLTNSQAAATQVNRDNDVVHTEGQPNVNEGGGFGVYTAKLIGSIVGNDGIVGVNQNAGNMNNQLNAVALAVGIGSRFALSEADLGQSNTNNRIFEQNTFKFNLIENSVNGNSGIVGVNQTTGNMNNQASVVSISALTSTAAVNVPFSR